MTAAELEACSDEELEERFARPLTFGTAGLRGPMRGGPNGMNLAVVMRTSWAVAQVLKDRGLAGSRVVVGRDARHGSEEFALAAAEVLAAARVSGDAVVRRGADAGGGICRPASSARRRAFRSPRRTTRRPTTATRCTSTAACRSSRPPTGRSRRAIGKAPHADEIPRAAVETSGSRSDPALRGSRGPCSAHARIGARRAYTAMHGVGGEYALDAFVRGRIRPMCTWSRASSRPTRTSRRCRSPTPRSRAPPTQLLKLAADVDADVAIALDPDADRCAVGVPTPDGWRMLTGDETGWLLGDYVLSQIEPGEVTEHTVVASTVVSSRMLAAIAAEHGARHVETLTGFKWLSRADADLPGCTLVYAYEEAIGHCVDPSAVRDKDGISAAVLVCDLVAALREQGRTVLDALDALARRHGVHTTTAVTRPVSTPTRPRR